MSGKKNASYQVALEFALKRMCEQEAQLAQELEAAGKSFAQACAEYGSELAGDNAARVVAEKLRKVREYRWILEDCLSGKLSLDARSAKRDFGRRSKLSMDLAVVEGRIFRRKIVEQLISESQETG